MKLVIIESPLRGDYELNRRYARACMRDSLKRGEAPFASHLLYDQPGILDDTNIDERILGITAGLAWGGRADLVAVYIDLGYTDGMSFGVNRHKSNGTPLVYRNLPADWDKNGGKNE